MDKSHWKNSLHNSKYKNDAPVKERLCMFMESLAQRLKRDGLRLTLLVLANGLYLYIGGMVFYFLERNDISPVDTEKQVYELYQVVNGVRLQVSMIYLTFIKY